MEGDGMDEVVGRMGVTTVRMNLEEMMSMQCHFGGRGAAMLKKCRRRRRRMDMVLWCYASTLVCIVRSRGSQE